MGFIASLYAELRCRVCKKAFCCKDCRLKHEENTHDIDPDCDICIKGNVLISKLQMSSKLLMHIKQKHWPLHCIFCQKVYTSMDEITIHNYSCFSRPIKSEKLNTKTPMRMQPETDDFESPPINALNDCKVLVTSTPMNSEGKSLISVPDHITPVESNWFIMNRHDQSTYTENSANITKNKRRVTFLSTPAMENTRRKPLNHENFLKAALKSSMRSNESTQNSFPSCSSEKNNSCYTTAPENINPDFLGSLTNETIELKLQASVKKTTITRKRRSYSMNETLWESAINETIALQEITSEVLIVENRKHNLSLDMNPKGSSISESVECYSVQNTGTNCTTPTTKAGVWSSMTTMFRNVVQGFQPRLTTKRHIFNESLKRHRSFADCDMEFDEQRQEMKRIKLCDVKCRPPIRFNSKLVLTVDKAIQTVDFDEI